MARGWLRERAGMDGQLDAFTVGELAALELVTSTQAREELPAAWKKLRRARPTRWK